jgi:cell division protease FtsH
MNPNDRDQPSGSTPPKPPSRNWWWIAILLMLLFWFVVPFFALNRGGGVALPYSSFVAQVEAGNVSSVQINGQQIDGRFKKPYKAPPPTSPLAQPSPKPAPVTYTTFTTTFPQAVGDQTLIPLLESKRVEINVTPAAQPWITGLLGWIPLLLLLGFFVWSMRRAGQGGPMSALNFGRAKPQRYSIDRPHVTFDDVADAEEAKLELQEEVDFLRHPAKYHAIGARIPKGILLIGPPGVGKTLLARAVAGEAGVPFFSLSASEFVEMFVGVGASRVRDLFRQAKESAPAIIFVDELDAVGRRRGAGIGTVNDEREQTLNQLLGELDGFDPRTSIIVLAATNRPDVLDPALLRPGRFDRQVAITLPDRRGREGILRIHTRRLRLEQKVDLEAIAAATIGMSGADLENVCNEAALNAARHDKTEVQMSDFEEALDRLRLGASHPRILDKEDRRVVAYHEAGHTLTAWLTAGADPVKKVTIVAHGMALGATEQLPAQERYNLSESYLKTRLVVTLGGRTAEELVYGEVTTGAEHDLVEATSLARQMVTTWGMSTERLLAFKSHEAQPFLGYEMAMDHEYSQMTATRIDADMQRLLEAAHDEARRILSSARPQLDEVVRELCEEETLNAEALTRILGPQKAKVAPSTDGAATAQPAL